MWLLFHHKSNRPKKFRARKQTNFKNPDYVHDRYTEQALKAGYKSRSVFKLRQINAQHGILKPSMRVLELGAAPGGWSRYICECIQPSGKKLQERTWLCAIDLLELDPELQHLPMVCFFQMDFTSPELKPLLLSYIQSDGLFDVILSDMAPGTTGNRTVDTGRSESLVGEIISLLPFFLKAGGTLLFKLFQGGGEQRIQQELHSMFASCKRLKPDAVRSQSFEIYFLCQDYNGFPIRSL